MLTATITMSPQVGNTPFYIIPFQVEILPGTILTPYYSGPSWIGCGDSTAMAQFDVEDQSLTGPTLATFITWFFTNYASGTATANFMVVPPGNAEDPSNEGPTRCDIVCGQPINLTTGNVWIQQQDYSVPGLGGGLKLSRVWNSRWLYASPPVLAGMFGVGWRSTSRSNW